MKKVVQRTVELPPLGPLPAHQHVYDVESQWAVRAALGARRPLLVRGEPGMGKSQLARAAAADLGRPLISAVVTVSTEPQDLHWRFDAVARLARAQVLGIDRNRECDHLAQLEERRFLRPGPLWWTLDWEGAERQWEQCDVKGARYPSPKAWTPRAGVVLLIDEIDKAEQDLPNGLLESLGNGEFQVPYLEEPVRANPGHEPPLVVITTNEERELPRAFLRRCLVLHLRPPEDLEAWLIERGRAHFQNRCSDAVYEEAAELVANDRSRQSSEWTHRAGLAEYIDLLRAALDIAERDQGLDPAAVIERVRGFVFQKEGPED